MGESVSFLRKRTHVGGALPVLEVGHISVSGGITMLQRCLNGAAAFLLLVAGASGCGSATQYASVGETSERVEVSMAPAVSKANLNWDQVQVQDRFTAAPEMTSMMGMATTTTIQTIPVVPVDRKIVYNAEISLKIDDLDKVEPEVLALVQKAGGYVADYQTTGSPGSLRSGNWRVRIPVERFESFLVEVARLGELESNRRTSEDVTEQFYDVEARVKNKKVEEERLIQLLEERPGKLEDILKVETELSRVRGEIEQFEGRLRLLSNLTSLTTVTIKVRERLNYEPAAPSAPRLPHASQPRVSGLLDTTGELRRERDPRFGGVCPLDSGPAGWPACGLLAAAGFVAGPALAVALCSLEPCLVGLNPESNSIMLSRVLELELMDSPEAALDYDEMDLAEVNARFVDDFLAFHGPCRGGPILDFGTGTARIPIQLCVKDKAARILAIDLAPEMLRLGEKNVAAASLGDRIILLLLDAKSTDATGRYARGGDLELDRPPHPRTARSDTGNGQAGRSWRHPVRARPGSSCLPGRAGSLDPAICGAREASFTADVCRFAPRRA